MTEHFSLWLERMHVYVEVRGSGKPLVFLHGLGGPLMWQKVTPLLERHFKLYLVHLPGFGFSDKPYTAYTFTFFLDTLNAILTSLGIERCTLVGISMGGQLAVEYTLSHPQRVEKVVLISPTGLSSTPSLLRNNVVWKMFSTTVNFFLDHERALCFLSRRSFYDIASRPKELCKKALYFLQQRGGKEAWLSALHTTIMGDQRFSVRLSVIDKPVLLVWGTNDAILPASDALLWLRIVRGSTLVTVSQCGHSVPLEKPEELAGAISKFV